MTEHVKLQGSVRLPRRKVASAASVKSSFQVPFKIQSPGKVCKRDGKLCMFTHVYAIIFPGGACAVMAFLLLAWTDFGKHVKFCFSPTGRETEAIVISNLMAHQWFSTPYLDGHPMLLATCPLPPFIGVQQPA